MKDLISAKPRSDGGRQRRASVVAALVAGAISPLSAVGDLDSTFGENGLLLLPIGIFGSAAFAVVQQPDGKLDLAGIAGDDFAVARLFGNGETDPAFSSDGVAKVDFFGLQDIARAVALQPDGKIVISGSAEKSDGTQDMAIARFNANGTLDSGFGNTGKATVDSLGNSDFARSMVLQPDGRLVIAGGTTDSSGATRPILVRLNGDGSLDSTFGAAGLAVFTPPGFTSSWINDVELQTDGKLVVTGLVLATEGSDVLVARVTVDGELDSAFGVNGIKSVDGTGGDDEGLSVEIQPDSNILIGGYTRPSGSDPSDALLVRLDSAGEFDSGFGIGGIATAELDGDSRFIALSLDPDGKFVGTGSLATDDAGPDTIVARFNSDGTTDVSFGNGGVEIVDYGSGADAPISEGDALIRQSDGRYVVVGTNSMGVFSAARFDDDAEFPGRIGLTSTARSIVETGSAITYTVRRTGGRSGAVGVHYSTTAGDAVAGLDFEETSGSLTWANGDASDRTISIGILDDAEVESDESFAITISAPAGGAQLAASEASTTIVSNDGPGTIGFQFVFDVFQPTEGVTFQIPVRRSGGSEGAVGVSYSTVGGTATAGTDFEPATGTLAWADGETGVKSIPIQILQDSIAEDRENFVVCLGHPTGGATIPIWGGFQGVLIIDDDSPDGGGGGDGTLSCGSTGGGGGGGGGSTGGSGGGGGLGGSALAWLALLALWRHRMPPFSPGSARSGGKDPRDPRGPSASRAGRSLT
jgi:uncharacterized delta-60 repeat protein